MTKTVPPIDPRSPDAREEGRHQVYSRTVPGGPRGVKIKSGDINNPGLLDEFLKLIGWRGSPEGFLDSTPTSTEGKKTQSRGGKEGSGPGSTG